MFCSSCGAKNEDTAKFCEECGARLEELVIPEPPKAFAQQSAEFQPEDMQQPGGSQNPVKPERTKNPMPLRMKIIIGEAAILVLLCFLCYGQIKKFNDPKNTIQQYMDAVMDQEWDQAYGYLYLPESPYLTAQSYGALMADSGMEDIINYKIEETEQDAEDITHYYEVQYMKKGSSQKQITGFEVTKAKDKKWLILDRWNITPQDEILTDVEILAYSGLTVELDGVLLNSDTAELETDGDNTRYVIPYLFKGPHTLQVSLNGFCTYTQMENIENQYASIRLKLPQMEQDTLKTLSENTADAWSQILEGVVNGTVPSFITEDLEGDYERSIYEYRIGGKDSYYTNISLDRMKAELTDWGIADQKIYAVVTVKGDVDSIAQYGRRSIFSQAVSYEILQESREGDMKAVYNLEGDSWVLKEFDMNL